MGVVIICVGPTAVETCVLALFSKMLWHSNFGVTNIPDCVVTSPKYFHSEVFQSFELKYTSHEYHCRNPTNPCKFREFVVKLCKEINPSTSLHMSSYGLSLLKCYLSPQVKSVELAAGIPTERLHF